LAGLEKQLLELMEEIEMPQETIQQARKVRAAAMVPFDPSSTDINVAARSSQIEVQNMAKIGKRGKEGKAILGWKRKCPLPSGLSFTRLTRMRGQIRRLARLLLPRLLGCTNGRLRVIVKINLHERLRR